MVERIIPKNEELAKRERKAIEDLEAAYPDRIIKGLDSEHRQLGKRCTKLYISLGYESRADMLEAFGFQPPSNKGGRPTTDPEGIIAELMARYEGVDKPDNVDAIIRENPDLKGPIRTIQHRANEYFGQSLPRELEDRGLIVKGTKKEGVTDEDIHDLLERLSSKYADAPIRPNNMAELKADNPDCKEEIAAFNDRCRMVFGVPPRKKLIELGIFDKPKSAVIDASADEIEQAIDELGALVMEMDDEDKPKSLADLQKAFPDLGEYVKAGKKSGVIDKVPLQKLGILAPTKALLRTDGIRRASVESLKDDYLSLGQAGMIKPDDEEADLLPPGVIGVDPAAQVELRECITGIRGSSAASTRRYVHRGWRHQEWEALLVDR